MLFSAPNHQPPATFGGAKSYPQTNLRGHHRWIMRLCSPTVTCAAKYPASHWMVVANAEKALSSQPAVRASSEPVGYRPMGMALSGRHTRGYFVGPRLDHHPPPCARPSRRLASAPRWYMYTTCMVLLVSHFAAIQFLPFQVICRRGTRVLLAVIILDPPLLPPARPRPLPAHPK